MDHATETADALIACINWLNEAEAIIIAAGAGMSFDSGLDDILPDGFKRQFPSMAARGYKTMLEAIGVDFINDPELAWGYYATRMKWYRDAIPHEGYSLLLDICKKQCPDNYYVFTSNVDGLFEKAGFEESKIYCKQGSYKYLQCIRGPDCSTDTWLAKDALSDLEKNVDSTTLIDKDPKLIPRCPRCHSVAYHNANANEYWVSNRYEEQRTEFYKWVQKNATKKIVLIELGCGSRLPFIRHPCDNLVNTLPNAKMIRINPLEPGVERIQPGKAIGLPYGASAGMKLLYSELHKV